MKIEIILVLIWSINLIFSTFILKEREMNNFWKGCILFVYFLSLGGVIFNILNI